jgi:hypothetical protein
MLGCTKLFLEARPLVCTSENVVYRGLDGDEVQLGD